MNVSAREALGTVRLTLGRGSSETEIRRAALVLTEAWRTLSGR
jgi:cysteine sulfinate desulfinase/cysteine desulfurase-like protein